MNIIERYNQEKECTIQYNMFELLQTDLNDVLKSRLMNLGSPDVDKFVGLFPIQGKNEISAIRNSLNDIKDILLSDSNKKGYSILYSQSVQGLTQIVVYRNDVGVNLYTPLS